MTATIFLVLRIAIMLALYAFIGWALWTIWRDLKQQSQQAAARTAPPITLTYQLDGGEQTCRFIKPEITIGRDPANDVYLEDRTISAQHTRFSYHHNHWWVEDLHSTNGTFLNQEPVDEPLVVTDEDLLRCGQVILQVSFEDKVFKGEKTGV